MAACPDRPSIRTSWVGCGRGGDVGHSDGLELVEGLEARVAAAQGLARGEDAEVGDLGRVGGAAAGAGDDVAAQGHGHGTYHCHRHRAGGRDPEAQQCRSPVVAHPVGRPRRRQLRADVGGIPLTCGLEDDA